jgi:hypothetical protein
MNVMQLLDNYYNANYNPHIQKVNKEGYPMSEFDELPEDGVSEEEENTEETTEEETDELSDFVGATEAQVDLPTDSYITVRANGGEPKYVPAQTSMTPRSLLQALSLTTNGAVEFWLNGAKID